MIVADMASPISQIVYRRAIVRDVPLGHVPGVVIEAEDVPAAVVGVLRSEDVASLGGRYGERRTGRVELERISVRHTRGTTEIEVFNRGLHDVAGDTPRFQRVLRVCEAVRAACSRASGDEAPATVKDLLFEGGPTLSPSHQARILAAGAAAVPTLVEVLTRRELCWKDAPGGGYAPLHAARLLGEMRAPEAAAPMLRMLGITSWDEEIHHALLALLPHLGEAVVDPALDVLEQTEHPNLRRSVLAILSELGVDDDRVHGAFISVLDDEAELAARYLADNGDASVIPLLSRAFDRQPISKDGWVTRALIELRAAIEQLGGALTPEQVERFERVMAVERSWRASVGQQLKRTLP
jgi:hypothetical protein